MIEADMKKLADKIRVYFFSASDLDQVFSSILGLLLL